MKKASQYQKRRRRRNKLAKGNLTRPRIVLFKSNRYLTVQAINDQAGHTLVYLDTRQIEPKNFQSTNRKNQQWAQKLAELMATRLKEKDIKKVFFDRNRYPYQGKIQVFCQTMRQAGIEF